MADFEELKLTVTLVDDASTGLASIRTQLTQLTQTAGEVQTAFARVSSSAQQVGSAAQQAAPRISSAEKALKELKGSAEETTRGMLQMGLAARRGMEAFPEMALGLREATQGLKGVSTGLTELAPASRVAVLSIGAIAVGVTAVTAAVVGFGITVFKFAREMSLINDTAKTLGMSFADLKNAIDIAEKFDVAAETVIRNFNGIAAAQANLSQNNSSTRHRLLGMGVDANFLNQVQNQDDPTKAQNMIADRARLIQRTLIEQRGWTRAAARAQANQFLGEFGQDPGSIDRPNQKEMTKEQRETYESIGKQSEKISEVWNEVYHDVKMIGYEIANWGMPLVLTTLQVIKRVFDEINDVVKSIKAVFSTVESWIPDWLKNVFRGMANGPGGTGGAGAVGNALRGMMNGPNGPSGGGGGGGGDSVGGGGAPSSGGATGSWAPSSYRQGANDNGNLFQRTSLTSGGGPNAAGSAGLPGGGTVPRTAGGPISGGGDVNEAIRATAATAGMDEAHWKGIASIESSLTPGSNRDKRTQYKGLFQVGSRGADSEWARTGSGDIYNAMDNAKSAARLAQENNAGFKKHFGRDPTPAETYLMHQQGLGFYTAGKMTNIGGNPYPGMRGPQTHQSFEAGWTREVERRAAMFSGGDAAVPQAATPGGLKGGPQGDARLSSVGNYRLGGDRRRQVLIEAANEASKSLPPGWRVEAFSGERTGAGQGPHASGAAVDFRLIDPDGKAMKDYQAPENFAIYERFAQDSHAALLKSNPALAAQHRWGGYFSGGLGKGGTYGAMDLMHQDFAGGDARMAAGQWATGLHAGWQRAWGVGERSSGFEAHMADRAALDRSALSKPTEINSTGKLDVAVSAPAGTKVKYHGQNLLKQTSMQRSTAMQETKSGPSVADTAQQYMAGN